MNLNKLFFTSIFLLSSTLILSSCNITSNSATILTPIQSQTQGSGQSLSPKPSSIVASPSPGSSQMSDTDLDQALSADWGKEIDTQFQELQTNLQ